MAKSHTLKSGGEVWVDKTTEDRNKNRRSHGWLTRFFPHLHETCKIFGFRIRTTVQTSPKFFLARRNENIGTKLDPSSEFLLSWLVR